jgi:hypothetical protein
MSDVIFTGRPEDPRHVTTDHSKIAELLARHAPSVADTGNPPVATVPSLPTKDDKMSMVVPPDYKGVVVGCENDNRGRDRDRDGSGISTKDAIAGALDGTLKAINESTEQTISMGKDNLLAVEAAANSLSTAVATASGVSATNINQAKYDVVKDACDKHSAISSRMDLGFHDASDSLGAARLELAQNLSGVSAGLHEQVATGFTASALAATNTAGLINVALTKGFGDVERSFCGQTAALQASIGISDAKNAACCCEIKALVLEQSNIQQRLILEQSNIQQSLALAVENRAILAKTAEQAARIAGLEADARQAASTAAILASLRSQGGNGGH